MAPAQGSAAADIDDVVAALHRTHALALVRTAKLLLRDQDSAEDVVQDAFLSLYRVLPRLRDQDQVLPYLRAAVINRARSVLRSRRRASARPAQHEPPESSAESAAMDRADRRAVLTAVGRLPRRSREVLVLRYYLDLPDAEIAATLGVSRGTVSSTASSGRPGRLMLPLAAAAMVAAIALGAVLAAPLLRPGNRPPNAGRSLPAGGPVLPAATFLTVTTTPAVIRGSYLVRYPVDTLQLRSVRNGQVIATLLRSLGHISAVMTRDGSVIAVEDYGCRSQVLRIDPRTGRTRLIRVLPESASRVTLSPDGRKLAYLTYPAPARRSCGPARQPASPVRILATAGGPAQFLPNVVAITGLASGTTVLAATSDPGNPPFSLAWSPDGTQIAAAYNDSWIALLSASHPDFAGARRFMPPHGCGYVTATWTVDGVLAVLGCGGQEPALSPGLLVRLSANGQRTASWRLPGCIDGIGVFADPTGRQVLVQADVGYGNAPPGCPANYRDWTTRIAIIRTAALKTIAVYPQTGNQLEVTGW